MRDFELIIHTGIDGLHCHDDNVDVEIHLDNGEAYTATFFTQANVARLFEKNSKTGECAGGLYFWAADMIIVSTLSEAVIRDSVKDLIDADELRLACTKIN